jgi:hypothetical protein
MCVGKSERIDVMWDTRLNFETTTDKEEMRKCKEYKIKHREKITKMDKLSLSDYNVKRSGRITGNVMYIGELLVKKFLPFKIFYISINHLLQDFLGKHQIVHYGTKEQIETSQINPKDYESDLESLLQFLRRTGEFAIDKEKKNEEKYRDRLKKAEKAQALAIKRMKKQGRDTSAMKKKVNEKKIKGWVDNEPAMQHIKRVYEKGADVN